MTPVMLRTKHELRLAEARVIKLQGRNVRHALRNNLTPGERDELGDAYTSRNELYATVHHVTVDAARRHYALLLMQEDSTR